MVATLGPNDNCQLWPKWQVPMCGAILIQTGSCHLGPVVAPNPVSQCAISRMATTGNCQSGARVAKICCVYFTENRLFWARAWLWHNCDVTLGTLVLISVCMERRDPSYTMVEVTCVGGFHFFKFTMGDKPPPWAPLGRLVTKTGLVRRG